MGIPEMFIEGNGVTNRKNTAVQRRIDYRYSRRQFIKPMFVLSTEGPNSGTASICLLPRSMQSSNAIAHQLPTRVAVDLSNDGV
jgi:hypothetical protein